jgi:hypothetical protein
MGFSGYVAIVIAVLIVMIAVKKMRPRRASSPPQRAGSVGPAAVGAFYEMLDVDRRRGIEVILEEKAGYRDPEDADGNLPDLERPKVR